MQLFHVAPIASRGSDIESFSSYVSRVASGHGITVRQLIRLLNGQWAAASGVCRTGLRDLCPKSLGDLDLPSTKTSTIISRLEDAIKIDSLHTLTFSSLHKFGSELNGIVSPSIRWCPSCLKSDHESGGPRCIHYRLYWRFNDSPICSLHSESLQSRCPGCNKSQDRLMSSLPLGFCQNCGVQLWKSPNNTTKAVSVSSAYVEDLFLLIQTVAASPQLTLSRKAVITSVRRAAKRGLCSEIERPFWSCVPKGSCFDRLQSESDITLRTARKIAYRLNVELATLLSGELPLGRHDPALDCRWTLPPSLSEEFEAESLTKSYLEERFQHLKPRPPDVMPRSIHQLSFDLGVPVDAVRYLEPELAHQVDLAFRRWVRSSERRLINVIEMEFLRYLNQYAFDESESEAIRVVSEHSTLSIKRVKQVLDSELVDTPVSWRLKM